MTTATAVSEREAKFDVDRDYDPPDLRDLVGRTERLPEQRLRTLYFDTRDRRLAERGITLRHRVTETISEAGAGENFPVEQTWTLKLPQVAEGDFTERTETSWTGDRNTVPPGATGILRGLVRRAQLQPTAELETVRRRLRLIGAGDTAWGELDDDLVTVVGGPRDGSWFRQLELELTGERPDDAEAVLRSLRQSGAKPSGKSKISIAIGDVAPTAPVPRSRKKQTVSDTIRSVIATNLDRLLEHDYRLRARRDQPDPHDVHQARVATRRMRSDLRMLAGAIDPVWLGHTAEDLRWIAGVLGEIRDLDVLAANVDPAEAASPGVPEFAEAIESQRKSANKKLTTALNSRRYLDLLDRLNAAREATPLLVANADLDPDARAAEALPVLIGHQLRSLGRQVRKFEREDTEQRLHKVRIRTKRVRYAAQTAQPLLGQRARDVAKRAEAIQDTIGELRDSQIAEDWLRRRVDETPLSTHAAFASGVLFERQRARQKALRDGWMSDWKQLNRKGNRKRFGG